MKYTLDTEFWERGASRPIELISIGIVSEDGRTYYAINKEFDWQRVPDDHWLIDNVFPVLASNPNVLKSRRELRGDLIEFFSRDPDPEFWAYYADYDWVVFCQIFGSMIDLPSNFPMLCLDIEQERKRLGIARSAYPPKIQPEHNALNDARWDMQALIFVEMHRVSRPIDGVQARVYNGPRG